MRDALNNLASAVASLAAGAARAFPTSFRIKGTEFFSGSTAYEAKISSDGELAITETERERNVLARYVETGINSTRYAALIDLSDTTNFKHDQTGRVDISAISMGVDRSNTATGTVKFGVITRIDGTNADISYFTGLLFTNGTNDLQISRDLILSPSQLKCGVSGGALTRMVTNDVETAVAAVNTGITLNSPRGTSTVTPAVGDIVIKMENTAGTYGLRCMALYHGEATA